jgi:hypothetical protein
MLTRRLWLVGLIAGCAEEDRRPVDLSRGIGMEQAIPAMLNTQAAFAAPGRLRGRPASAARAVAQVEYLADELQGLRWVGFDPFAAPEMLAARQELRGVLGIAPEAPPQVVIDALVATADAIDAGGAPAAALSGPAFRLGPSETLARLADLPPLPRTARATSRAADALQRYNPNGT